MSAFRDEIAALQRRLELETQRADRAEAAIAELHRGREHTWTGDIQLFVARGALLLVPLCVVATLALWYGLAVVTGDIGDTIPFAFLSAVLVSPLLAVSPLAAFRLDKPSRAGWGLALFSFLYMVFVVPPIGLWGLYAILRGRVRDAVFGEEASAQIRVEIAETEDVEETEPERIEVNRTSRSDARGA